MWMQDASMPCWDAGRMRYAGTRCRDAGCRHTVPECGRDAGCRRAVPGCRRDACQGMSTLCKAMLLLSPGQLGRSTEISQVPVWEKEQLVTCSVKMASHRPKERWDKFKSQPQFCREVSLFSVILETADSVAGAGAQLPGSHAGCPWHGDRDREGQGCLGVSPHFPRSSLTSVHTVTCGLQEKPDCFPPLGVSLSEEPPGTASGFSECFVFQDCVSSPFPAISGPPQVWREQPSWEVRGTGLGQDGFGISGGSGCEPQGLGLAGLLCPRCCPCHMPIRLEIFCNRKCRHARAPKKLISSSFPLPLWQG